MCLIALIKFVLKFILPIAIIGVVIYFVYFKKSADAYDLHLIQYLFSKWFLVF